MNINWNNYIQNNSLIRRQIATRPQDRKEEQYILHACTNKDKNDALYSETEKQECSNQINFRKFTIFTNI